MHNNETACTSCAHKDVCKYKEDYLKVCEAASNINVTLKDHYEGGLIHCKYYERASDIIRSNAYA